jgi:hypothetical protein
MKYVEFYDTRSGKTTYLGEIRLENNKLVLSEELAPHWQRHRSYGLLGKGGYETMYEPEKILEALPDEFPEPEFQATKVKSR